MVLDGIVIIVSYLIAWYGMMVAADRGEIGVLPAEIYMMALLFIVPFFLLLYMPAIYTRRNGYREGVWKAAIS